MSDIRGAHVSEADELRSDLETLLQDDGSICLVATRPKSEDGSVQRAVFARKFTDVDSALEHVRGAEAADTAGELSFYVVRNPSGPELMVGQPPSRRPARGGQPGNPPRESELIALRWLAVDIDPAGDDGEGARSVATGALVNLGVRLWFIMDSGRGVQAQLRLAEPAENTPENRALLKACARALYARVESRLARPGLCKVDHVQNLNRQTRLVGTANRKTDRRARITHPIGHEVESLGELAELLGVRPGEARVHSAEATEVGSEFMDERLAELAANDGWEPNELQADLLAEAAGGTPDLSALSPDALARVGSFGFPAKGGRSEAEVELARDLLEHGEPAAGVLGFLAQPGRHCADQGDTERALGRAAVLAVKATRLVAVPEMTVEEYAEWWAGRGSGSVVGDSGAYPLSEDHLAQVFVDSHADDLTYCAQMGRWYEWVGDRWGVDETHQIWNLIRPVVREAAHLAPKDTAAIRIARTATIVAVEKLARSDRRVARRAAEYDRDLDLLNTPGGVVQLPTGELLPHDRDHLMTRATGCTPTPGGTEPTRWLQALREWTGDDAETMAYLQQACGLMLSGQVREHVLLFLWGPGANGKSAFANVVRLVLGDYVTVTPTQTLTVQGGQQHPTDLAALRGARVVQANETEQNVA